jgi:hypothetical protein
MSYTTVVNADGVWSVVRDKDGLVVARVMDKDIAESLRLMCCWGERQSNPKPR